MDLTAKDVERRLLDFLRHPKAVGIRHVVQDEPDVDWLARPDVLRGLRILAKHGVPFDVLTYVRQLKHAATIAKIDGLQIVLDHLSKPLVKEGKILGWIVMTMLLRLGAPFWHDARQSLFGVKNLLQKKNEQRNVEQARGAGNPANRFRSGRASFRNRRT